jgi:hypothetical protein
MARTCTIYWRVSSSLSRISFYLSAALQAVLIQHWALQISPTPTDGNGHFDAPGPGMERHGVTAQGDPQHAVLVAAR